MRTTWVIAIALSACAAPRARLPAKTPPTTPAAAVVDDEWARESWDERHDTMEFIVHPNMAQLFQENAHTTYPEMTCRTCHGADAEAVNYAMPHGLPPLDPAHMPDTPTAKFMTEEVTPKMIVLLGTTSKSFGCFNCHPRQK